MTLISIKDAIILSHLSRKPADRQRQRLTQRLGQSAKAIEANLVEAEMSMPVKRAIRSSLGEQNTDET